MSCNSHWVVYQCECKLCKCYQSRKSKTKLNMRFNNNKTHLNSMQLVEDHHHSRTCNLEKDLPFIPTESSGKANDKNTNSEQ